MNAVSLSFTAFTETDRASVSNKAENMLAVTIAVGGMWEKLAELAAASVRARTGLSTRVLGAVEMSRFGKRVPQHLKFKLFEACPDVETILYFDADTLFLRNWDPRVFAGRSEMVCVRDEPPTHDAQAWKRLLAEAKKAGLPVEDYFNSGLLILHRAHHSALLARAEQEAAEFCSVFHDQTYLNRARRVLGVSALWLPGEYNRIGRNFSAEGSPVVIGHLAGALRDGGATALRLARAALAHDAMETIPAPVVRVTIPSHEYAPAAPDEDDAHRQRLEAVVAGEFPFPAERFAGRGVVICGGGFRYFPCVWVCVKMLRHLGCTLPIEVWHLGPREMTPEMRGLLEPLGVMCVDAHEVRKEFPVRRLHGWELKAYALLHCSFREALLLDADNVAVRDPGDLFEAAAYVEKGAVFWPDYGRLAPDRSIWRITGVPYRCEPEFESGQILVDKSRCWHALQLAMHLNEFSDFYYRHVHGDKETFHLAWRKLNQDYAMPARGIESLDATMCQHDFEGKRIFQHRNFDKWNRRGSHRRIHGFQHEETCLSFLSELAECWQELPVGVHRYGASGKSAAEAEVATRLVGTRWDYHRVGHDRRSMTFSPDGCVAIGAAGCEVYWDVRTVVDTVCLEIYSETERTMQLRRESDQLWRGRWDRFERMPVELIGQRELSNAGSHTTQPTGASTPPLARPDLHVNPIPIVEDRSAHDGGHRSDTALA
jgi:hypothetical protein